MSAVTSLLYVPNVVATKADGADKGSKFVKTCLAVFKEMCASSAVLFPLPLTNLNTAIGQLNSVNTLFQVPFRYGEWKSQVPDGNNGLKKDSKWGLNEEKSWLEQSNNFYSKALLTAGLVVESARILQANYVLPVTANLFSVMGKVPVFQTASRVMNSFPAGSFLSNLAMKVSGLEMIKNILFIGSSVFALKKACADYVRAQGNYSVAIAEITAANLRRGTLDDRTVAIANRNIALLDIEKSSRAYWKETTKLTVIGTASLIVLGFITSPVLLTMFNTVTVATAAFNLWCVVKDEQAADTRAKIENEKKQAEIDAVQARSLPVDQDDEEEVGTDDDVDVSSSSSNGGLPVDLVLDGADN